MQKFAIAAALCVVVICTTTTTGVARAEEPSAAQAGPNAYPRRTRIMTDERFWALIQPTTAFENDPDRQIAALHSALENLSTEEIEAFEEAFGRQLKRSYSWDLWGAAYVVHGGASDDGFEYFRRWLISKGRRIFERVVADPDSLADIVALVPGGPLEFESFGSVARRVWSEKTGRKAREMPDSAEMVYIGLKPSGTPFDEDATHLAKRYPKLWQRFGTNPLQ
jgi:hypothetical protein